MFKQSNSFRNTSLKIKIKDNFIATLQVTLLWMLYSGSALWLVLAAQVSDTATQQALIGLIAVYAISLAIMKRVFIRSKQYKRLNKEKIKQELKQYIQEDETDD